MRFEFEHNLADVHVLNARNLRCLGTENTVAEKAAQGVGILLGGMKHGLEVAVLEVDVD